MRSRDMNVEVYRSHLRHRYGRFRAYHTLRFKHLISCTLACGLGLSLFHAPRTQNTVRRNGIELWIVFFSLPFNIKKYANRETAFDYSK